MIKRLIVISNSIAILVYTILIFSKIPNVAWIGFLFSSVGIYLVVNKKIQNNSKLFLFLAASTFVFSVVLFKDGSHYIYNDRHTETGTVALFIIFHNLIATFLYLVTGFSLNWIKTAILACGVVAILFSIIYANRPVPRKVYTQNTVLRTIDSVDFALKTSFKIERNYYDSIPDDIYKLTNLTEIQLDGMQVQDVPHRISNLLKLETVRISRDSSDKFPEGNLFPRGITGLYIDYSMYRYIPTSIEEISKLERLAFSSNLNSVPDNICNLKHLRYLNLSSNNLKSLPSCLRSMKSLENLIAKKNQLTNIDSLTMSNVSELDLSNNPLVRLPDSFNHTQLVELFLEDCLLKKLPEGIVDCVNLKILLISNNPLERFPEGIGRLKIETLAFEKTKILTFPEEFYALEYLTHLYIRDNNFRIYPEKFKNKEKIKLLSVNTSQISHVTKKSFVGFKNLTLAIKESDDFIISSMKEKLENENVKIIKNRSE